MERVPTLVTTAWLADHLGRDDVAIIDATWHLPTAKRDAAAEYAREHIPGAAFFDLDAVSDHASDLPHMLPAPEAFGRAAEALGIGNDDHVIVYDTYGLYSAARVWWMFRVFGHDRVSLLDGGLAKWKREARPVDAAPAKRRTRRFTPRFRPELVRSKDQVLANLQSKREQVVDARPAGRFRGADPEPRAGLRGGHIPGSRNLPFANLIDPNTKTVMPAEKIRAEFAKAGIDPNRPVVASCGSGVTACVLILGLDMLGAKQAAVYDGSWSEWGLPGDTPVETG